MPRDAFTVLSCCLFKYNAVKAGKRPAKESPPDREGKRDPKNPKSGRNRRRYIARREANYRRAAAAASRRPVTIIRRRAAMRDISDELVARMAALSYYS